MKSIWRRQRPPIADPKAGDPMEAARERADKASYPPFEAPVVGCLRRGPILLILENHRELLCSRQVLLGKVVLVEDERLRAVPHF